MRFLNSLRFFEKYPESSYYEEIQRKILKKTFFISGRLPRISEEEL